MDAKQLTVVLLVALCGVVTSLPFESMRSQGWNVIHDPSLMVDSLHYPADPIFGGAETILSTAIGFSSYTLDPVLDQNPPAFMVRGYGALVSSYKCQLACDVTPACGIAMWNSAPPLQCWLIDAQKITSKQRIVTDYDPAAGPHWNVFRHMDRIDADANLIRQVVSSDAQLPFHRFWDFETADNPILTDPDFFFSSQVAGCTMQFSGSQKAWWIEDRATVQPCFLTIHLPDNLLTKPWRLEMTFWYGGHTSGDTAPVTGLFAYLGGVFGKRIDAPLLDGETNGFTNGFKKVQFEYFPQTAQLALTNLLASGSSKVLGISDLSAGHTTPRREDLGLVQPQIVFATRVGGTTETNMYIKSVRLLAFQDPAQDTAARTQASVQTVKQQFDANFVCASSSSQSSSSVARWCSLRTY